jgi:hypothetical protein
MNEISFYIKPSTVFMEKVTIKELIEFRNKSSNKSKQNLALKFKTRKPKEKKKDSKNEGGDYWISCTTALSKVFSNIDLNYIDIKIEQLKVMIEDALDHRTKIRFQKNIDLLYNFKEYDFEILKPKGEIEFIKKVKRFPILDIKNIPIQVDPQLIFTFNNNGFKEIGSIWFIAKKKGFKKNELSMFCDISNRYLNYYHSDEYKINPNYVTVVDVYNCFEINYTDIITENMPNLLDLTIDEVLRNF